MPESTELTVTKDELRIVHKALQPHADALMGAFMNAVERSSTSQAVVLLDEHRATMDLKETIEAIARDLEWSL